MCSKLERPEYFLDAGEARICTACAVSWRGQNLCFMLERPCAVCCGVQNMCFKLERPEYVGMCCML